MNPTLPEVLIGQAIALAAPQPPEASGAYMAARIGMVAMLATLAAQEAERGPAARVWENAALRALLGRAVEAYDGDLGGLLAAAAATNWPKTGGAACGRVWGFGADAGNKAAAAEPANTGPAAAAAAASAAAAAAARSPA